MTQRRRLFPIAALAATTIAAAVAGQAAAQAPPASCASAQTTADMRECLDLRLRRAEASLARVTAALRAVPGVDLDRLTAAERAWQRYRDAECGFAASLNAGGTLAAVNELGCRITLTTQRTGEVRRALAQAAPPAPVTRCHTADLAARVGATDAAVGNRRTNYILINISGRTCSLRGYPGMSFHDESNAVLRGRVQRGSRYLLTDPGPSRIVLAPGRAASFSLGWTGAVVEGCVEATRVRITPPDERSALGLRSTVTVCPRLPLVVSALVRGRGGAPPPA